MSRKRFLQALGIGGVIGVGHVVIDRLISAPAEKVTENARSATTEVVNSYLTPYEEWSSSITLPTVDLKSERKPMSREELERHVFPDRVDPEKLQEFYRTFHINKRAMLDWLRGEQDIEKRRKAIGDFFLNLFGFYAEVIGRKEPFHLSLGQPKFGLDLNEVNRLLLPEGYSISQDPNGKELPRFSIYEVGPASTIDIHWDGKTASIPYVQKTGSESFNLDSAHKPITFEGEYMPAGNYIIFDPEGRDMNAARQWGGYVTFCKRNRLPYTAYTPEQISADFKEQAIVHEAMHAAVTNMAEFAALDSTMDSVSGDIDMGDYVLKEADYRSARDDARNLPLHELIAIGYENTNLINAPHFNFSTYPLSKNDDYQIARRIFVREILHLALKSSSLRQSDRRRIDAMLKAQPTGLVHIDDTYLLHLIHALPKEAVKYIAERVTKLGLYLAAQARL